MTHISKKKITVFSTILASGLLFGAALSIASCSGMSKTINPFFSSFEENDAYTNRECSTPTNISLLETQRTTGPTNGYGTNIDNGPVGYTGLHSFEYKATYINDQTRTTFSNYIYKDLNVVVGKDTEFSYKIFPNFADNSDDLNHNLNYLATYASVDLLYNDNATPGK
ncbi:MAG: hypothetical protein LBT17_02455, partial [Mycoplasmataceae bacterium]|nr:hypothetical protein [Mycoplasmataceae bacterium]